MTETSPDLPEEDVAADVTMLLRRLEAGDGNAADELFRRLYPDLRRQAEAQMRRQGASHTLQATALVHEAFIRLAKPGARSFEDRRHFLLTASRAMRHVLIDHARGKNRIMRSAARSNQPLDEIVLEVGEDTFDIEALEAALVELERRDPVMARGVELRFFGGLNVAETADVLKVAPRTFDRRWLAARAWLRERLEE